MAFLNLAEDLRGSFFFAKILNGFKLFTIFEKKLRRRCSIGLKMGVWLSV